MKLFKKILLSTLSTLMIVTCLCTNVLADSETYTVTWLSKDNETISTEAYNSGETPSFKGQLPEYYGYVFLNWDKEIVPVSQDTTYKAVYAESIGYPLGSMKDNDSYGTVYGNWGTLTLKAPVEGSTYSWQLSSDNENFTNIDEFPYFNKTVFLNNQKYTGTLPNTRSNTIEMEYYWDGRNKRDMSTAVALNSYWYRVVVDGAPSKSVQIQHVADMDNYYYNYFINKTSFSRVPSPMVISNGYASYHTTNDCVRVYEKYDDMFIDSSVRNEGWGVNAGHMAYNERTKTWDPVTDTLEIFSTFSEDDNGAIVSHVFTPSETESVVVYACTTIKNAYDNPIHAYVNEDGTLDYVGIVGVSGMYSDATDDTAAFTFTPGTTTEKFFVGNSASMPVTFNDKRKLNFYTGDYNGERFFLDYNERSTQSARNTRYKPDDVIKVETAYTKDNPYELVQTGSATRYLTEVMIEVPSKSSAGALVETGLAVSFDDIDTSKPVSFTLNGGSVGGCGLGRTRHSITKNANEEGGTVSVANRANVGSRVGIKTHANNGYTLNPISVTTKSGSQVALEGNSFIMPDEDVVVNTSFSAIQYQLTYIDEDGNTYATKTSTYGQSIPEVTNPDKDVEGYYKDAQRTQPYDIENETVTSDKVVYIKWAPLKYIIRFNANGAEGTMIDQNILVGTTTPLSTLSFTRTGYTFTGWNTDVEGTGDAYANGAQVTDLSTKNNTVINLYAQWRANTYTVKYHANGGDGTIEDQEFTYDVPQNLASNTFEKEDYAFVGWNTNANGTGTKYDENQEVSNLTSQDNGVINLYPEWVYSAPYVEVDSNAMGIVHIQRAQSIEKLYVYKAKEGVTLDQTKNYYTSYGNMVNDGTSYKTFAPCDDGQTFIFKETGEYIIRIKYTDSEGNPGKYTSQIININSVNSPVVTKTDDTHARFDNKGFSILKLYVGYTKTENITLPHDKYKDYNNFMNAVGSNYTMSTSVDDIKDYFLDRPGYSYVFRIKFTDVDETTSYAAFVIDCPTKEQLFNAIGRTTAYLDIDKNTIKAVMADNRLIEKIELICNNKVVTYKEDSTSIKAPFNGDYIVKIHDFAGNTYDLKANIKLSSLGEIKDVVALQTLVNNINSVLTNVEANESNIITPGSSFEGLRIKSALKTSMTNDVNNAQALINDAKTNGTTVTQKQITDTYNALLNAYNLFLTKLQVNVLTVSSFDEVKGVYTITIDKDRAGLDIETVYIKGSKGSDDSQGVFLEDYADFVSVGNQQSLASSTDDKIAKTTRKPGLYTVRYKVKLTVNDFESEFRAASYLLLNDDSDTRLVYAQNNLDENVLNGLEMYRLAYNYGFEAKKFTVDLVSALNDVHENKDVVSTNTELTTDGMTVKETLSLINPTDAQVCVDDIVAIREALADMPKLSDSASKTVYMSYLFATKADLTDKEFSEADFNSKAQVKIAKGNTDENLNGLKGTDNFTVNLNTYKYVRIGVNNVSNIRVAYGNFNENSTWADFSSAPYSTYYDSVINYEPKWNGTYTVRIKYVDNTYAYLHFNVTGAPDPITVRTSSGGIFNITVNGNYTVSSIQYAYSRINDGNYWPATSSYGSYTATALGNGEHIFKVNAVDKGTGTSGIYYVKHTGFTNINNPVVVSYTENGKTIVGIYSNNVNTLAVAYGTLGSSRTWDQVQNVADVTYTTKNGAISLDGAKSTLKFAFALSGSNPVIKTAKQLTGSSY